MMEKDDKEFQPAGRYSLRSDSGSDLLYDDDFGGKMRCSSSGMNLSSLQELPAMTGPVKPRRKIWSRKSQGIIFGGVVLIILSFFHFHAALFPRVRQLGVTRMAEPTSRFGIGFQLTPSYALSAIRYANGTVSNLARVDFETITVDRLPETFYHMMKRLVESKYHLDEFASDCHDDNIGVGPIFLSRRWQRKAARRLIGLPSTEDVGHLADAIRSLKEQTEEKLGHEMFEVMITAPMFHQLCRADIREAAEYIGLKPLMDTYPYHSHDVAAAYAGYGLGICKDYRNRTRCAEEEGMLPTKNTLTVLYTKHVLMVSFHRMKTTDITEFVDYAFVVEWHRFLAEGNQRHPDAQDLQIQFIALRLAELSLDTYTHIWKIDRIVLMGESGGNGMMASAVKRAMELLHQQDSGYEVFAEETEFVAARGMAELAWRKQFV